MHIPVISNHKCSVDVKEGPVHPLEKHMLFDALLVFYRFVKMFARIVDQFCFSNLFIIVCFIATEKVLIAYDWQKIKTKAIKGFIGIFCFLYLRDEWLTTWLMGLQLPIPINMYMYSAL